MDRAPNHEAFPWNEAPRYLIRDQHRAYGTAVTRRLRAIGIREKPISPGSPWQNCFAERLIERSAASASMMSWHRPSSICVKS